jgi:hypothetical protein
VTRRDDERLADIVASAEAIASHLERGGFDDGLVFDPVRVRLIEIGEAVKDIDPDLLATEPGSPGATSPGCATTSPTDTSTPLTRSSRPRSSTTFRHSSPRPSGSWPDSSRARTRRTSPFERGAARPDHARLGLGATRGHC